MENAMTFRTLIAAGLLALLVGCGGDEPPAAPTTPQGADAPPAAAPTAPAPGAEGPAEAPAASTADATEPVEAMVTESAGETSDDAEAVVPALAAPAAPAAADWKYSAGDHYSQLTSAQGTVGAPGGVEVAEVFWYGCPHCFNFDPYLTRWQDGLPEDVRFVRIPVMWNPTNEIHARMFYTAVALGKLEEMHSAFFRALHLENKTLTREADIREFFGTFGVTAADFDQAFRSFAVESNLKRAKNLTQRYRIRSVPVLVVNGKYVTDGPQVKSFEDMIAVADELVDREQQQL
jgi:thiol:disulfide interchange protein DsbA